MHKWTVRAARVALVAAAISAVGAGVANADNTTGDHSILGGDQIHVLPIFAPIGLFGNRIGLNLLNSGSASAARYAYLPATAPYVPTDDTNAYQAAADAPQVDICGNAIASAHGIGTAACKGQAQLGGDSQAAPPPAPAPAPAPAMPAPAMAQPDVAASASLGTPTIKAGAPATPIGAPGQPIAAPVVAPAETPAAASAPASAPSEAPASAAASAPSEAPASAPAAAAPAEGPATAQTAQTAASAQGPIAAPAEAPAQAPSMAPAEAPAAAPAPDMVTSGDHGVLSGNQVKAPVRMPVRICGNAGALGGMATAACDGTASIDRAGVARAIRTMFG